MRINEARRIGAVNAARVVGIAALDRGGIV